MIGQILVVAGSVIGAMVVVAGLVVIGWRAKSPLVLRPVVAFSRSVINPRQLRTAGARGASASVIRHVGRKSGRAYETPLDAVPIDGGFLVALVYGARTNWLRNVVASGSATIVRDGVAYAVDRPEVVSMADVAEHFPPSDRRGFRVLAIDECLRVRSTAGQAKASAESQAVAATPASS